MSFPYEQWRGWQALTHQSSTSALSPWVLISTVYNVGDGILICPSLARIRNHSQRRGWDRLSGNYSLNGHKRYFLTNCGKSGITPWKPTMKILVTKAWVNCSSATAVWDIASMPRQYLRPLFCHCCSEQIVQTQLCWHTACSSIRAWITDLHPPSQPPSLSLALSSLLSNQTLMTLRKAAHDSWTEGHCYVASKEI